MPAVDAPPAIHTPSSVPPFLGYTLQKDLRCTALGGAELQRFAVLGFLPLVVHRQSCSWHATPLPVAHTIPNCVRTHTQSHLSIGTTTTTARLYL
jgi:hypothetical protein